jgi:LAO/AO transport system kinase
MAIDQLMARFESGQRGALARLLTYVENENPRADELLEIIHRRTGQASIIGITGPPGAGKSTLTNAMIRALRARGDTVAVIAVDPSSSISGGATLGDRIRMLETYNDDGVYIRSMATRGQYGGLSLATGRATHVLDAFGFDVIILETVGVGQDEVDVAAAADTTILLQVPGLGDSVQTIKAGVLEIADILVVNKAELPDARVLQRDLRAMLRYRGHLEWVPPVVATTSTTGEGIDELLVQVDTHRQYLATSGEGERRQRARLEDEIRRLVRRDLERLVDARLAGPEFQEHLENVQLRKKSPLSASRAIIDRLLEASENSRSAKDPVEKN